MPYTLTDNKLTVPVVLVPSPFVPVPIHEFLSKTTFTLRAVYVPENAIASPLSLTSSAFFTFAPEYIVPLVHVPARFHVIFPSFSAETCSEE